LLFKGCKKLLRELRMGKVAVQGMQEALAVHEKERGAAKRTNMVDSGIESVKQHYRRTCRRQQVATTAPIQPQISARRGRGSSPWICGYLDIECR
jgi:hypothetical protein